VEAGARWPGILCSQGLGRTGLLSGAQQARRRAAVLLAAIQLRVAPRSSVGASIGPPQLVEARSLSGSMGPKTRSRRRQAVC